MSMESSVSYGPRSPASGTSGKTSAASSAFGRLITVSALAMMKTSAPAWPGWEQVADYALDWALRHARQSSPA